MSFRALAHGQAEPFQSNCQHISSVQEFIDLSIHPSLMADDTDMAMWLYWVKDITSIPVLLCTCGLGVENSLATADWASIDSFLTEAHSY